LLDDRPQQQRQRQRQPARLFTECPSGHCESTGIVVGEVVCVKFLDTPFVVACAFVWGILKIKCTKGGFYFINKTGNGSFCCLLKHSPTQQQQRKAEATTTRNGRRRHFFMLSAQ